MAEEAASTAVLKALAHPIRREILTALERLRSGRAADLARELDIPANKLSFHLRTLADAGLITEDPSLARDRRDRVWVTARREIHIGSPGTPIADAALSAAAVRGIADDHEALVGRVLAWAMENMGRDVGLHAMMSHASVHLTPSEFSQFLKRSTALLEEFRDAHDSSAEDGYLYEIDIVAANETV
jgi:DNA-binding transcriptional ArsR family regulator